MAKAASNSSFLMLFFCFIPHAFSISSFQRLYLPDPGPVSFAFDLAGQGPYTTVADGRILKYQGPFLGFVTYAYTSANRSAKLCDGTNDTNLAQTCGRGLDLGFYYKTGQLFVANADSLVVVGPGGGPALQLATSAGGVPFKFLEGLDVDQDVGTVYFTDASANFNISQIPEIIGSRDMSGRLLKFDPRTKTVSVLLSGLGGPTGVAISEDHSYLLVTEFVNKRVLKYWLKGPKAYTVEVLLNLSGNPDKIKRTNLSGNFWIAVTVQTQEPTPTILLQGQRISGNGNLLETLTFSPEFNASLISEVNQYKGNLFLGSIYAGYIGVYKQLG